MLRSRSTANTPSTMPASTPWASASRRRSVPVKFTRLRRMSSMVRASAPTSAVPPTGIEVEKSPWREPQRRLGEILHRACDELAEHRTGQHRQQRQHQRGDQQAMDERADFAVDLRGRQPRLDQRDGLPVIGEQREAGDEQIQRLDMRHGIMAVGKPGTVHAGQLVHGGGGEAAVVDQADRQPRGATQVGRPAGHPGGARR